MQNLIIEITDVSVLFLCIALVIIAIVVCDTVERIKK